MKPKEALKLQQRKKIVHSYKSREILTKASKVSSLFTHENAQQ